MPIQVPQAAAAGVINAKQSTYCRVAKNLGDAWRVIETLIPIDAANRCAPEIGAAQMLYRYGPNLAPGETAFFIQTPADLEGWYVQIVLAPEQAAPGKPKPTETVLFTGIMEAATTLSHGNAEGDPSGMQEMVAYELSHLLDKYPLDGALIYTNSEVKRVGRVPTMNYPGPSAGGLLGNRSDNKETIAPGETAYVFSEATSEVWTHLSLIESFLMVYDFGLEVKLAGQHQALDALVSVLDLEGMTFFEILCRLIEPRNGFGWYLTYELVNEEPTLFINVYTITDKTITAGSKTIPANATQAKWNFTDKVDVAQAMTVKSRSTRYDRILVRGGFIKSMGSLEFGTDRLEKGWDDTSDYDDPALPDPLDPDLDEAAFKDSQRKSESFRHIYQHFVIPPTWDRKWDGEFGSSPACPVMDGDTVDLTSTTGTMLLQGKRLLRHILLPTDSDATDQTVRELSAPLAWIKDTDDRYVLVDRLSGETNNGLTMRMLDNRPGVELRGPYNHLIGKNHFSGDSESPAVYDYEEIAITVAIETDERLEIVRETPSVSAPQTLIIDRPEAQAWYIAPGTYIGVDVDGQLDGYTAPTGQTYLLRDDTDHLKALAELALSWYGQDRARVEVVTRRVGRYNALGTYVTESIHGPQRTEVNAILTSRSWDFHSGTTTLTTDFKDIALDDPLEAYRAQRRQQRALTAEVEHTQRLEVRTPPTPF